jgi:hypothetical protein
MDEFNRLDWDLTQSAAWALTREPDAVRAAADLDNEGVLFDIRAAHLARWRKVNERLWVESGWAKPHDALLGIEVLTEDVRDEITMIPSLSDERYAERLRQLETEGKVRRRWHDTFPINDYLRSLCQTGELQALHYRASDAGVHAIPKTDWAFFEIVGGDHERLTVRRQAERSQMFGEVRISREQVLSAFPAIGEPRTVAAQRTAQQKKTLPHLVADALGRLYGSERPEIDREGMRHAVTAEIRRKTVVSIKTLDRAIKLTWPSPNRAKSGPDQS